MNYCLNNSSLFFPSFIFNKRGNYFTALMHICNLCILDMCIRGEGSCESLQEKQPIEETEKGMEMYGRQQ